jgi:hypothetical protein
VPTDLRDDPLLWNECLSGALYWNDFLRLARECGFADPRLVSSAPITVQNSIIEQKLSDIRFYSATYRLFKLPTLEPDCEDYGQAVRYRGTIVGMESAMSLDDHHTFRAGKLALVCGNTFDMLKRTRFAKHFEFFGDQSTHYGIFEGCGKNLPFTSVVGGAGGAPCC